MLPRQTKRHFPLHACSLGTNAPVEAAIPDLGATGSSAVVEPAIPPAFELSDDFDGLACDQGLMTIAGFGSLLSETSARRWARGVWQFRVALARTPALALLPCCAELLLQPGDACMLPLPAAHSLSFKTFGRGACAAGAACSRTR